MFSASIRSIIVGECDCDSVSQTVTCTYTVVSGIPGLSHLVFPMPPNCVENFTFSSEFFNFEEPAAIRNPHCEDAFGLLDEQGMGDGQEETFTITYDACYPIGEVYALIKSGRNCEMIPVPGVVDCPFVPCVEWSLDASAFNFYVRKPGIFASRLATMIVEGNIDLNITFESFGDLLPVAGSGSGAIPAFYATAPAAEPNPPLLFLTPADFNQQGLTIPGDEQEHRFSLWSKIEVTNVVTGCEYQNEAAITLTLENSEAWIDDGE